MDRIEFTNILNCSSEHILNYFDEFMSAYDLLAYYDMLKINYYNILNNSILFNVSISSNYDITQIKKILDTTVIQKYSKLFYTYSIINEDNTLDIVLNRWVSG